MSEGKFDPRAYLIKLPGRKGGRPTDYLEVKHRVRWLRAEHPEADIQSTIIEITDVRAIYQVRVSIPNGGAATATGSEVKLAFADFIEKAETVALGRALAILGYGIDFADEYEESKPEADKRDYELNQANTVAQTTASPRYHTRDKAGEPVAQSGVLQGAKVKSAEAPTPADFESFAKWFDDQLPLTSDAPIPADARSKHAAEIRDAILSTEGMDTAKLQTMLKALTKRSTLSDQEPQQLRLLYQVVIVRKRAAELAAYAEALSRRGEV